MTEIRVGIDQAWLKLRSAQDEAIMVNQEVGQAHNERDVMFQARDDLQAKYAERSTKYLEIIGSLDQAVDVYEYQNLPDTRIQLQEAQNAAQQAEAAFQKAQIAAMQAQAEVQACFDEVSARSHFGNMAIDKVQEDRSARNGDFMEDIRAILDQKAEQEVVGARRTRSQGGQELG